MRYNFCRLGLLCFAFVNAGIYVFSPSPASAAANPGSVKTISISMWPQTPINPLIYGVNYVWSLTPEAQFPAWIYQMTGSDAQPSAPTALSRYPGGWDAESYDWNTNEMYAGGPSYTAPGEPPAEFLDYIQPLAPGTNTLAAAFVLPSSKVVQAPSAALVPLYTSQLINTYQGIISLYNSSVEFWEIGNEWWLQGAAGSDTAPLSSNTPLSTNLSRYAQLIASAAPILKADYPNIKLYVTADWTTAGGLPANDEFVQLRDQVGTAAWALIDGISVHLYCGTTVKASLCSAIPQQIATIKRETGKSDVYASEWSLGTTQSTNNFGIRNANATASVFQDLASGGVTKATYWPSSGGISDVTLSSGTNLTATGVLFRIMALLYQGYAIPSTISLTSGQAGQTVALAAKNDVNGVKSVTVIIPTNGDGRETINLSLAGTGTTQVVGSSVMYSANFNSADPTTMTYTVPLSVSISKPPGGSLTAQFVLNPGRPGRGSNWEIAFLQLQ